MKRHLVTAAIVVGLCARGSWLFAALLAVDINDRTVADSPNTPSGFEAWVIDTGTTGSVTTAMQTLGSGYTLKFDIFDDHDPNDGGPAGDDPGAFDDRDRTPPSTAPTLNQIYDDFIFAGGSAGPTGGLDMTISGGALLPNTQYFVSIYAYDGSAGTSVPTRTADWFDGNNSDALVLTTSFTIATSPTTDDQYKFTGVAMTNGAGQLFLKGRRTTAGDVSVYVNGVEVDAVPEPMSVALALIGVALLPALRRR